MRACVRVCLVVSLALCAADEARAGMVQVRVVHLASIHDTIDVEIKGERVARGLRFRDASEYHLIRRGEYPFRVLRRGQPEPLIEGKLALRANGSYTVALTGTEKKPGSMLLRENSRGMRKKARMRFVHVATGVPPVVVAEPEVEKPLTIPELPFGHVSPEKAVSPGRHWLEIRPAAGGRPFLDLRGINLKAGTNYTVFLIRGPRGRLQALPTVTAVPRKSRVRFVELDAEAPAVDLYVNRRLVLERVPPCVVTSPFELPPGIYLFEITRVGNPQWVLGVESVTIGSGQRYTLAASSDLDFKPSLVMLRDDRRVRPDRGRLRIGLLAPDLPPVDIAVRGGDTLATLSVNEASGYQTLPPGLYDLELRERGGDGVLLEIPGIEVEVGVNATYLVGGQLRRGTLRIERLVDIDERFVRGDVDRDGHHTVIDAFRTIEYLYTHLMSPICLDAADYNDDGKVEIDDAVWLVEFLFEGKRPPLSPYPEMGLDRTRDRLPCTFGD